MSKNKQKLHELYEREEDIKGSSNRGFGLTVGGILLAICAVLFYYKVYKNSAAPLEEMMINEASLPLQLTTWVALFLVIAGLLAPRLLTPLNKLWTGLGLLMFKVINPLIMAVMFFGIFMPIGVLMRLFGKDPMQRRTKSDSYWVIRTPPGPKGDSLVNQF